MKTSSILTLILVASAIVALMIFGFSSADFSTYESIVSAKQKPGKTVTIIAKLDTSKEIEYSEKNPNYLVFYITDSLNAQSKVVYHDAKPTDFEKSEKVVLKGSMQGDVFECKSITLKCPSKYKDNKSQLEKSINDGGQNTSPAPAENTTYPEKAPAAKM
ncbi:MAG: cytochrome c maturation protein CcmE [Chitinophagaceae bacterium]